MVERGFSTDPCHGGQASVSINIAETIALSDHGSRPLDEQAPLQEMQPHCCFMHVVGMPPVHHGGAVDQVALSARTPLPDAAAPHGEQAGQDRPPRISAIA
ncbi:MAG: hypothetical protein ABL883_04895 [Terricaulis sp.]